MDALANAIVQKEALQQILRRLSPVMVDSTTCHDLYRSRHESGGRSAFGLSAVSNQLVPR
jgi:hypothetical protein